MTDLERIKLELEATERWLRGPTMQGDSRFRSGDLNEQSIGYIHGWGDAVNHLKLFLERISLAAERKDDEIP